MWKKSRTRNGLLRKAFACGLRCSWGRDGCGIGCGVEDLEILLEPLHHQHQFAAGVEGSRRTVVDQIGRTAHLVDHHDVLALDVGQLPHQFVAVGESSLAVAAGVDRDDGFDRLVEIVFVFQIAADDDGAAVVADGDVFESFRRNQKAHLATGRDVFFTDETFDFAVFDDCCGADGAVGRQHRQPDDGGDVFAMACDVG